jgi:hypothetical protein
VLQWFISQIETFAPAAQRQERRQLYADIGALPSPPSMALYDDVGLFVCAQIVAAHQLIAPRGSGRSPERSSAHTTWYAKERQRVAKLLLQIAESPVVASFRSTVTYYDAADVTCQHGRNQKTCEALYALRLTLHLLERHQAARWARKQVERLRQREPHLPPLHDLCVPLEPVPDEPREPVPDVPDPATDGGTRAPDDLTAYLLGTIGARLRHAGLTVGQSCALVDRVLHCCFGRSDPGGTRAAVLAEQWRRLSQHVSGA